MFIDEPGIRLFAFHGKRNAEFTGSEPGDMYGDALRSTNGRWVYENTQNQLNTDDVLHYWVYVQHGVLAYRLEDQKHKIGDIDARTPVDDVLVTLQPSAPPITPVTDSPTTAPVFDCKRTISTVRGRMSCAGELVFDERFDDNIHRKWQPEVRIPLEVHIDTWI